MVSYRDYLPLEWFAGDLSQIDDRERLTTNLYVLEAVAAVEDKAPDHLHEEQPELHLELQRLDAKLQLLMDMVARLLRRDERFPGRCALRLAVELIEIGCGKSDAPPLPDMVVASDGVLHLHLHPAIPAPLLLPGRIIDETRDDEGRWLRFRPLALSTPESEALSRHVFRHHRRDVAAARQSVSAH